MREGREGGWRGARRERKETVKFIVWVMEHGKWVEQGDGPLTEKQAQRIAREIRQDCGVRTCVRPVGVDKGEEHRSLHDYAAERESATVPDSQLPMHRQDSIW